MTDEELNAAVDAYYDDDHPHGGCCGGNLDWNLDDKSIRFAQEQAYIAGDMDGLAIADALLERHGETARAAVLGARIVDAGDGCFCTVHLACICNGCFYSQKLTCVT